MKYVRASWIVSALSACLGDALCSYKERTVITTAARIRPNEKEISHGRVSWQIRWTYFAMGPLASSIG